MKHNYGMDIMTAEKISEMTIRYITSPYFVIPTKGILDTESKIKMWMTLGACGGIIYGRPRIGKTRCIYHLADTLKSDTCGNIPVIIWNLTDHAETEKNFYSSLLMAMGFECPKSSTALIIKERVINALIAMACETPLRRVVLLIDEAWKFYEKDFAWLMDLYNNLIAVDIQLFAFMFGTRELHELKLSFKQSGKDQIIGRFMINEIQYSGIRSEDEMRFCLASMDKLKMVTKGYKKMEDSLLDFYFPNAEGRSFYDLSGDFYKAFSKVKNTCGMKADDIPMKYFIDSFIFCINLFGFYGSRRVAFPGFDDLLECIEMSGYKESDNEYDRRKLL